MGPTVKINGDLTLRDLTYLARGKRGIASTARLGRRLVLVKERNPRSVVDTVAQEARILARINAHGLGPRLIRHEPGRLVREYVDGALIEAWTATATPALIRRVLAEFLDQCRTLDTIGIDKAELTRPFKHLLIRRGHPVQIDYDRARESQRPRNVTQACQFLTSGRYAHVLASRGVVFPKETIIDAARTYKNEYAARDYARLRALVRGD